MRVVPVQGCEILGLRRGLIIISVAEILLMYQYIIIGFFPSSDSIIWEDLACSGRFKVPTNFLREVIPLIFKNNHPLLMYRPTHVGHGRRVLILLRIAGSLLSTWILYWEQILACNSIKMVDHGLLLDFLNKHVGCLHVMSLINDHGVFLKLLHLLSLPHQVLLVHLMSGANLKGDTRSLHHVSMSVFRSSRRCQICWFAHIYGEGQRLIQIDVIETLGCQQVLIW